MFAEERPQGQAMQGISIFAYTRSSVPYACSSLDSVSAHSSPKPEGRLAQLVRAPALQAGGRRFEPCTAHHFTQRLRQVIGMPKVAVSVKACGATAT